MAQFDQSHISMLRQAVYYYSRGFRAGAASVQAICRLIAMSSGYTRDDTSTWPEDFRSEIKALIEREAKAAGIINSEELTQWIPD